MSTRRLYRSRRNSIVSGVCGGLGDYFNIDPVIVRIITVVLVFNGVGLLAYIIGALIIPLEPFPSKDTNNNTNSEEPKNDFSKSANINENNTNHKKNNFFEDDSLDGEKIVEVDLEEEYKG